MITFVFPQENFYMKKLILPFLFVSVLCAAQAPEGYYAGTEGLTGYALKSKLHEIVSRKVVTLNYSDLQEGFGSTDLDIYYDHDASNTEYLLDMYSEKPSGPDQYEYTTSQMTSGQSAEGLGWNREHIMPQSTFYSNYPMYSDMYYIIPADAFINGKRSNNPYGIVGTSVNNTFSNGSKLGKSAIPNYAYTGKVYEPIDEFKGDIARSLLYFAVRFEGKLGTFKYNTTTSASSDANPLDGTEERAFDPAYIAMLKSWNENDPVSQREKDRNNSVYGFQHNRNPFVDHPEWVNMIWDTTTDGAAPSAPKNLTATESGAYFATLSWEPSADPEVLGYRIYNNGTLLATSKNTTLSLDHLTPGLHYQFTVKAYDQDYLESEATNSVNVDPMMSDMYAKDLMITKYLEGSGDNKAIEITNKTGHAVDLGNYRISVQFYSSANGNYYFPAPFELEGTLADGATYVLVNRYADFSCFQTRDGDVVTSAPQLLFSGGSYLELRYKSQTVDAIGVKDSDNYDTLGNVSLYRNADVKQPSSTFSLSEWTAHESDFCENLGENTLAVSGQQVKADLVLYPNPVHDRLFISGKDVSGISAVHIYDMTGRKVNTYREPFRNSSSSIDLSGLKSGLYLISIDGKTYKIIHK